MNTAKLLARMLELSNRNEWTAFAAELGRLRALHEEAGSPAAGESGDEEARTLARRLRNPLRLAAALDADEDYKRLPEEAKRQEIKRCQDAINWYALQVDE